MTLEGCERGIGVFRRDGDEETAGSLRIEKKVLIFGWDASVEFRAPSNEGAIIS